MTGFRAAHKAPAHQGCLPGFEAIGADAAQFRATRYETIAPLLARLNPSSGHWVEPCAGDGDIVRHVARAAEFGLCRLPSFWSCIELRPSPLLESLVDDQDVYTAHNGRVWVFDEQDFLTFDDYDPGVSTVITNWPWPGHVERLASHAFAMYPRADIVGLICVREWLDGRPGPGGHGDTPEEYACEWCAAQGLPPHDTRDRREWFRRHTPDLYWCNGRQPFDGYESGYPHPLAWCHWPAGESRARTSGRWEVLPPYSEVCP